MADIPDKTFCYKHKNKETGISCTECGRYICYKCITQLPVGQKCQDCLRNKVTHLEIITLKQYLAATIVALIVSCSLGYLFLSINNFGIFYKLIFAYIYGFIVSKLICKTIGYKISIKIQLIAVISIFIGLFVNPINLFNLVTDFSSQLNIIQVILIEIYKIDIVGITAFIVASWAAIRHLRW